MHPRFNRLAINIIVLITFLAACNNSSLWTLFVIVIFAGWLHNYYKDTIEPEGDSKKEKAAERDFFSFIEHTVCSNNKVLYSKFERLCRPSSDLHVPSKFALLIKDRELRREYCLLGISYLEILLKIHQKEDEYGSHSDYLNKDIIVALSFGTGIVVTLVLNWISGLIVGAVLFYSLDKDLSQSLENEKHERYKMAINIRSHIVRGWKKEMNELQDILAK